MGAYVMQSITSADIVFYGIDWIDIVTNNWQVGSNGIYFNNKIPQYDLENMKITIWKWKVNP